MAHGSAGEIRGALDLADAWGWQVESAQARTLLDRELGLLWGLTRRDRSRNVPDVIGFDDVPRVRDRVAASRLPELAVLSAMAHPELEIAEIAIEAISGLPEDQARLYFDVIVDALPAAIRQLLEARVQHYEYQSDFARKYFDQGLEQGRQDGLEQGHRNGLRGAVVALARIKLDLLSDDDLAAIDAVADPRVLTQLVTALGEARSAPEARAALDRGLGRQEY